MHRSCWAVSGVLALGLIVVSGCGRSPEPATIPKSNNVAEEENPLTPVEPFRGDPSASGLRNALRLFEAQLQRPEARAQLQLTSEERELLDKRFHLDQGEFAEIEASFFRPLDAYHLEECFLLRDVARAVKQPGAAPLQQAELCLDWVCRQVLLRETAADLVPPSYVLRQGYASARERALVLLALLRQLQISACVVAWPEAAPGGARTVLAGVVAGTPDKTDIYLFDPRLGRPVPGPGGKGIATLADLRKQPALFAVSKEDAAARPEVLLSCPLLALAPRLRFLEKHLAVQEQVALGVDPAKELARLEKAAGEAVGVWNPPAGADRVACNSPTRMLRSFLPRAEGGLDSGLRQARLEDELTRKWQLSRRLMAMGLLGPQALIRSSDAQTRLVELATRLTQSFALDGRSFLLRGQYDKAAKRLDMIASAYDDLEFSPLEQNVFVRELREWCQRTDDAHLAKIRQLPNAQALIDRVWSDDQYLLTLIEAAEKPSPQKQKKTIVTVVLLTVLKDSLGAEVHYLLAENWQEKAERAQAAWRLASAGDPARAAKLAERAQDSWQTTAGWWRKCLERYSLEPSSLAPRLKTALDLTDRGDIGQVTSVWNYLMTDIHRSSAARLNLARALEHGGKKDEALHHLGELQQSLAAFRSNPALKQALAEFTTRARAERKSSEFLDSLARDLGPQGGIQALGQMAHFRIREINAK
jgi:hypothetical protein